MLCSGQNVDNTRSRELIEGRGTAHSGRPSGGTHGRPRPRHPLSSVALRADGVLVPSTASAAGTLEPSAHAHDILTTAAGSNRLGVFVDFIRAADLARLLLGEGPFTVFAPTDRAFAKMSLGEQDALLADRHRLGQVMRGHLVAGSMSAPSAATPSSALTLSGTTLFLTLTDGVFHVGTARLIQTNIPAANGTIHAIDSVLLPT